MIFEILLKTYISFVFVFTLVLSTCYLLLFWTRWQDFILCVYSYVSIDVQTLALLSFIEQRFLPLLFLNFWRYCYLWCFHLTTTIRQTNVCVFFSFIQLFQIKILCVSWLNIIITLLPASCQAHFLILSACVIKEASV